MSLFILIAPVPPTIVNPTLYLILSHRRGEVVMDVVMKRRIVVCMLGFEF
jgi:hypothetical protein